MKLFLSTLFNKILKIIRVSKINRLLNKNLDIKIERFLNRLDPRFIVMIGLTYACQCNCAHCAAGIYKKDKEKELSDKEWLEIIDQLPKKKVRGVYFFGGEPLLRRDILQLINRVKERGLQTILDTNGFLLTKEMAKILKKTGLDIIEVSIDNADSKIHNNLRGLENLFERAIEGIKSCLREGIFCGLSTYATKENIKNGDLKKIILLAEKLGVNFIRVLSAVATGKWLKEEEIRLDKQERKQLKKIIKNAPAFLDNDYCDGINKKLIYISPYGEVQPCCFIPFTFGNIKEESLEKILKRMWKHPMFKMKTKECLMNNEEFREKYFGELELLKKFPIALR